MTSDGSVPGDPVERLAALRHEFGEHGGVNMSIEASTTFTVMEAGTMSEIFQGRLGTDSGQASADSITFGRLPLVTRNVEVPCWWQTSRNSPSLEYSVGSPFSDIATCFGF